MGTHTTTSGKIKVSIALDPHSYAQLKAMATGPRAVGTLLDALIAAEATRRGSAAPEVPARVLARHDDGITILDASGPPNARQAAAAVRLAEQKYRALFASIDEGFCVIQVLFDAHQRPLDYRFLEVNPAFERQTGIENAVGRTMRAIAPQHEAHWFEIYGQVALTGEPTRFENRAEQLHRYYDVYAFRVGEPAERKVAILFNDITPRKQAEEALRANRAQLQMATRRLMQLQETERRALSRDLHDTSGQGITALKLGLGALKRAPGRSESDRASIDGLLQAADTIAEDLHRLAVNLRPAGLAAAADLARAKALSDALVAITAAMARCSGADEILRLVLVRSTVDP